MANTHFFFPYEYPCGYLSRCETRCSSDINEKNGARRGVLRSTILFDFDTTSKLSTTISNTNVRAPLPLAAPVGSAGVWTLYTPKVPPAPYDASTDRNPPHIRQIWPPVGHISHPQFMVWIFRVTDRYPIHTIYTIYYCGSCSFFAGWDLQATAAAQPKP